MTGAVQSTSFLTRSEREAFQRSGFLIRRRVLSEAVLMGIPWDLERTPA